MEEKQEDPKQNNTSDGSKSDLQVQADNLKAERDEYLNGWKRAKADLVNYQKDEAKRLGEIAKFGTEDMLRDIISVVDNMNLAYLSIGKASGKIDQGLILIKNQLLEILKKRGVMKIELKPGDLYNPMYHEAIEMTEPTDTLKSGMVAEVVEDGYVLHDYVLKPARVKVVQ